MTVYVIQGHAYQSPSFPVGAMQANDKPVLFQQTSNIIAAQTLQVQKNAWVFNHLIFGVQPKGAVNNVVAQIPIQTR